MRIILSLLFFVFGLILILFFGHYNGTAIRYPLIYLFAGFLLIIFSLIFLRSAHNERKKKLRKQKNKVSEGEFIKIKVDLNACKIIDNKYFIKENIYASNTINLLNVLNDSSKNVRIKEIVQARIIYNYLHNGLAITFVSPIINKDKSTLFYLLEKQKYTYIYLNKNDFNDYIFDLDFLC